MMADCRTRLAPSPLKVNTPNCMTPSKGLLIMFQTKLPKTPTIPYSEIKKFHLSQGQEKKFLAFQHCARNLFIRERLYYKQHGLCPICGKQIIDLRLRARIHHNTYDHCCESPNPEIMVHCPQKNGYTYTVTPNCELCYFQAPELSEACLDRLVLIHDYCHN